MIRPDFREIKHSNELYHYGIKQRSGRYPWGSGNRPYQSVKGSLKGKGRSEYFETERTIPKGTKMYRTTSSKSPNLKSGSPTNVTYLTPDRNRYKGGIIRRRDKSDDSYEHTMTLNKELKIPSRETFVNSLNEVIKENPNLLKESFDVYIDRNFPKMKQYRIAYDEQNGKYDMSRWDEYVKNYYKEVSNKPVVEQWGRIVTTLDRSTNLKEAVIDNLTKKGYNAMVDETAVGSGKRINTTDSLDPLIIFDSSILNEIKSEKISREEENRSQENYMTWTRKTNIK